MLIITNLRVCFICVAKTSRTSDLSLNQAIKTATNSGLIKKTHNTWMATRDAVDFLPHSQHFLVQFTIFPIPGNVHTVTGPVWLFYLSAVQECVETLQFGFYGSPSQSSPKRLSRSSRSSTYWISSSIQDK